MIQWDPKQHIGFYSYTSDGLSGSDGVFQYLKFRTRSNNAYFKSKLFLFTCTFIPVQGGVKCRIRSAYHGLFSSASDTNKKFRLLLSAKSIIFLLVFWLVCLLLQSGDVEPNPGPDSVENISLSSSSSAASLATLQNLVSIMHLNIQSLTPKIDLVKAESMYMMS